MLNRIAYGPRPGDLERVRQIGIDRYIDEQLHPDRISDGAVRSRLASLSTLSMGSRDIAQRFELPVLMARRQRRQDSRATAPVESSLPDRAMGRQAAEPMLELAEAKLLRAIYSDRQLEEVLTDFWFNHFNVDARKGPDRFMLTQYERDAIRPHVLGKFRDLLEATAKSPAMLFYLDNWMSADPNGGARVRSQRATGLNENYGRELMELHTLGVDGGYTQKDVTEVARAFTGWTIDRPRLGGGFRFEPRVHDDGQKIVLGHVIKPGGGQRDGEQVLDLLASHPSTAHFIATQLVRRFVSDTPPSDLVDRTAATFRRTNGDLREVMRTILSSTEFRSAATYGSKAKTPLEFVASAIRATGAEVFDAAPLVREMRQLGMPLYMCQPPTGYKDDANEWMNTGALVNRMNFATALAANRVPGISVAVAETPKELVVRIGGPEFQKR